MTPRLRRLLIVNSCEHEAKKEILRLLEAGGLLLQLALYLYTGLTRDIIEFPGRQDGSVLRSRMVKVKSMACLMAWMALLQTWMGRSLRAFACLPY